MNSTMGGEIRELRPRLRLDGSNGLPEPQAQCSIEPVHVADVLEAHALAKATALVFQRQLEASEPVAVRAGEALFGGISVVDAQPVLDHMANLLEERERRLRKIR